MALQTRFLASCGLRLVPVASSGIIYCAYPLTLLGALKSYVEGLKHAFICVTHLCTREMVNP